MVVNGSWDVPYDIIFVGEEILSPDFRGRRIGHRLVSSRSEIMGGCSTEALGLARAPQKFESAGRGAPRRRLSALAYSARASEMPLKMFGWATVRVSQSESTERGPLKGFGVPWSTTQAARHIASHVMVYSM